MDMKNPWIYVLEVEPINIGGEVDGVGAASVEVAEVSGENVDIMKDETREGGVKL